jgi:hypothetical protein
MARSKRHIVLVDLSGLQENFARLVDIAPTHFVVQSEETDWSLVGGDFRAAMDAEKKKLEDEALNDRDEDLVEA